MSLVDLTSDLDVTDKVAVRPSTHPPRRQFVQNAHPVSSSSSSSCSSSSSQSSSASSSSSSNDSDSSDLEIVSVSKHNNNKMISQNMDASTVLSIPPVSTHHNTKKSLYSKKPIIDSTTKQYEDTINDFYSFTPNWLDCTNKTNSPINAQDCQTSSNNTSHCCNSLSNNSISPHNHKHQMLTDDQTILINDDDPFNQTDDAVWSELFANEEKLKKQPQTTPNQPSIYDKLMEVSRNKQEHHHTIARPVVGVSDGVGWVPRPLKPPQKVILANGQESSASILARAEHKKYAAELEKYEQELALQNSTFNPNPVRVDPNKTALDRLMAAKAKAVPVAAPPARVSKPVTAPKTTPIPIPRAPQSTTVALPAQAQKLREAKERADREKAEVERLQRLKNEEKAKKAQLLQQSHHETSCAPTTHSSTTQSTSQPLSYLPHELPHDMPLQLDPLDRPLSLDASAHCRQRLRSAVLSWNLIYPPPVSFRASHLYLPTDTQQSMTESRLGAITLITAENDGPAEFKKQQELRTAHLTAKNNAIMNSDKQLLDLQRKYLHQPNLTSFNQNSQLPPLPNANSSKFLQFTQNNSNLPRRPVLRKISYFSTTQEYIDYFTPLLLLDIHASLSSDYEKALTTDKNLIRDGHNRQFYAHAKCLALSLPPSKQSTIMLHRTDTLRVIDSGGKTSQNQQFHALKCLNEEYATNPFNIECSCPLNGHFTYHPVKLDLQRNILTLQRYQYSANINYPILQSNAKNLGIWALTEGVNDDASTQNHNRKNNQNNNNERDRDRVYDNLSNNSHNNNTNSIQKTAWTNLKATRVPIDLTWETEQAICIIIPELNLYVQPHRPHKETQPLSIGPTISSQQLNEFIMVGDMKCYFQELPGTVPLIHFFGFVSRVNNRWASTDVEKRQPHSELALHIDPQFTSFLGYSGQINKENNQLSNNNQKNVNAHNDSKNDKDLLLSSQHIPNGPRQFLQQLANQCTIFNELTARLIQHHSRSNPNLKVSVGQYGLGFTGELPFETGPPAMRLRIYALNSIVSQAREFLALHSLSAYPIIHSLLNPIMHPTIRMPTASSFHAIVKFGPQSDTAITAVWRCLPEKLRKYFESSLNPSQLHAVKQALYEGRSSSHNAASGHTAFLPAITLMVGPPGTGKSKTLVSLLNILHIVKFSQTGERAIDLCYQMGILAAISVLFGQKTPGEHKPPPGENPCGFDTGYTTNDAISFRAFSEVLGVESTTTVHSKPSLSKPKFLVCAPSNGGVDEIASRIMQTGIHDGNVTAFFPNIIRIGNVNAMRDTVSPISLSEQITALYRQPWSSLEQSYTEAQKRLKDANDELFKQEVQLVNDVLQIMLTYLMPLYHELHTQYCKSHPNSRESQLRTHENPHAKPSLSQALQFARTQSKAPNSMQLAKQTNLISPERRGSLIRALSQREQATLEARKFKFILSIYDSFGLKPLNGAPAASLSSHQRFDSNFAGASKAPPPVTVGANLTQQRSLLDVSPGAFFLRETKNLAEILVSAAEIVFSTASATAELLRDETDASSFDGASPTNIKSPNFVHFNQAYNNQTNMPSSSNPNEPNPVVDLGALNWDALFVDEACQCTETGVVVGLMRKVKHCVLVGDPQQLPSTVFLSKAVSTYKYLTQGDRDAYVGYINANNTTNNIQDTYSALNFSNTTNSSQNLISVIPDGLLPVFERSLFERLQHGGHPVHMLTQQYRMHPLIVQYSNAHFYGNRISTAQSVLHRIAYGEAFYLVPLLGAFKFYHITPQTDVMGHPPHNTNQRPPAELQPPPSMRHFDSNHWNWKEALAVCQFVCILLSRLGTRGETIGIITFYQGQKQLLAHLLPLFVKHFVHNNFYYQSQSISPAQATSQETTLYNTALQRIQKTGRLYEQWVMDQKVLKSQAQRADLDIAPQKSSTTPKTVPSAVYAYDIETSPDKTVTYPEYTLIRPSASQRRPPLRFWTNPHSITPIHVTPQQIQQKQFNNKDSPAAGRMIQKYFHINDIQHLCQCKVCNFLYEHIEKIHVGTVDSFQGSENNIMLISCVRTTHRTHSQLQEKFFHSIGFLKDGRRVNVAMTRAKQAMYVFGDAETLSHVHGKKLQPDGTHKNTHWDTFIQRAKDVGCFEPHFNIIALKRQVTIIAQLIASQPNFTLPLE